MTSLSSPEVLKALAAHQAAQSLTALTARVLVQIERLIAAGDEMPNNVILADMLGNTSRQGVSTAIIALAKAAIIRIETRRAQRRVVDLRTGNATDWGHYVIGHAPGRAAAAGRSPKLRRALTGSGLTLPPQPPLAVPPIGRAAVCQWPLWAHGSVPNQRFCGDPCDTSQRFSFCSHHLRRACAAEQP